MAEGSKPALNPHIAAMTPAAQRAALMSTSGSTSSMSSLIGQPTAGTAGFPPSSAGFSYFGPTPSSSAAPPTALMNKINPWSAAAAAAAAGSLYSAPTASYSYWAGSTATTPVTGPPITTPVAAAPPYPYPPAGYAAYGLPTASASLSDLTSGLYPMSTASVSTAQGSTPTGITRTHSAGLSSLHSKGTAASNAFIKSSVLAAMRNSSGSSSSANTATGSSLFPTPSGLIQKSGLATAGLVPPPGSSARTTSDMTTTTSQPDGEFAPLFGGSTPLDHSDTSRFDALISGDPATQQRRPVDFMRPSDSPTDRAFNDFFSTHRDQYRDYVGGGRPDSGEGRQVPSATSRAKHVHHFEQPPPSDRPPFQSFHSGDSRSRGHSAYAHPAPAVAVPPQQYLAPAHHDYPRYLDASGSVARYPRGPHKPPLVSKVGSVTATAPPRPHGSTATVSAVRRPVERVSVSKSAVMSAQERVVSPSSYASITAAKDPNLSPVGSLPKYAGFAPTSGPGGNSSSSATTTTAATTAAAIGSGSGGGGGASVSGSAITSTGLNERVIKEISEQYASKRVGSFNPKSWPKRPRMARFFVIKSYGEDDVHKSIKYGLWASTKRGNVTLQKGWERAEKSVDRSICSDPTDPDNGCPVYLFFSVNRSRCFCGMAQLMSGHDKRQSFETWVHSDKWKGTFRVDWVFVKDIPNKDLQDIKLPNNEFKPVTFSRDTQEIPFTQGLEMLRRFVEYKPRTIILQDFDYYNQREQDLKEEREKERAEREKARKMERQRVRAVANLAGEEDSLRHEYGRSRGSPDSGASLGRAAIGYYDDPPPSSYDDYRGSGTRGRDRARKHGGNGRNRRGRARSGRSAVSGSGGGRSVDSSYGSPHGRSGFHGDGRRNGGARGRGGTARNEDGSVFYDESRRKWGHQRSKMHDRSVATARAHAESDVSLKKVHSKPQGSVTPKKQVWQRKSPVSSLRTTEDSSDRRPPTTETDIDSCPSEIHSAASPGARVVTVDEDTKEVGTDP